MTIDCSEERNGCSYDNMAIAPLVYATTCQMATMKNVVSDSQARMSSMLMQHADGRNTSGI